MHTRTRTFIDALARLEETGDPGPLVALFAEGADVSNPLVRHEGEGGRGADAFWRHYRGAFTRIGSTFRSIVDDGETSMLEWTSEGETAAGPVRYGGVSVIAWEGERIAAFRTYFDPSALSGGA